MKKTFNWLASALLMFIAMTPMVFADAPVFVPYGSVVLAQDITADPVFVPAVDKSTGTLTAACASCHIDKSQPQAKVGTLPRLIFAELNESEYVSRIKNFSAPLPKPDSPNEPACFNSKHLEVGWRSV